MELLLSPPDELWPPALVTPAALVTMVVGGNRSANPMAMVCGAKGSPILANAPPGSFWLRLHKNLHKIFLNAFLKSLENMA